MKKLLTIASGLVASSAMAFEMPALKVDGKIEYNSKWVSEGVVLTDHNFAPSMEIGLPLFGAANLYVGMDAHLATNTNKSKSNRIDPYVGFSYDVTDMFTLDVGYRAKVLVSGKQARVIARAKDKEGKFTVPVYSKKVCNEIYAGVMADVLLKPSLYFSYDFGQKKINLEGAVAYTFDLGNVGTNGLAIDLGAKVGYTRIKKPLGLKMDDTVYEFKHRGNLEETERVAPDKTPLGEGTVEKWFGKKSYFYAQLNADLVYSLNENSKIRAGVGVAFNNAKMKPKSKISTGTKKLDNRLNAHALNSMTGKKHAIWFSTAAEFSF